MPERRWSWRLSALLALLTLVLVGSALLWSARKPIARGYIDRLLAKRGVPAHYQITRFGFRTQQLEHVVIGDPANPDLTADWVEIGFGLSGVSPSLRTIRAKGVRALVKQSLPQSSPVAAGAGAVVVHQIRLKEESYALKLKTYRTAEP